MPTYQYACTEADCGHSFEQVQAFSDDALTACPQCEGRLRKVFNAVGVVFKGSGFYRTDSRQSADKGDGSGDKSGTPATKEKSTSTPGERPASTSGEKANSSSTTTTPSGGSPTTSSAGAA